MNLKKAIEKIQNIAKQSFNSEQKKLAEIILRKTSDNGEIDDKIFQFILPIIKTGFVFDKAPEVDQNNIAITQESKNFKRIGTNGVNHSLIIGENYEALKNLKLAFSKLENGKRTGLIDIIYIDPPYNTYKSKEEGNDYKEDIKSSGNFIYRDKYKQTGWLNMMHERLKIAKDLLKDDGVIFISIDDSELGYLIVLCDEIFGEDKFVTAIPRLTRIGRGGGVDKDLCKGHDYILVYSFDNRFNKIKKRSFKGIEILEDKNGKYIKGDTSPILASKSQGYSKGGDYDFEYQGKIYKPIDSYGKKNTWLWNKERMEVAAKLGILVVSKNQLRVQKYLDTTFEFKGPYKNQMVDKPKNFIFHTGDFMLNKFANLEGSSEMKKMFSDYSSDKWFTFPKPLSLIKELIKLKVNNENAIILDFFAGSGTTGQAVMELNEEDGGNRKFILVTNNENNIAKDITYERLYRAINGKGSKNQEILWKYSSTKPSLTNNTVNIFEINHYPCSNKEDPDILQELVKSELIKLNPDAKFNYLRLNRDLSSLFPYDKSKLNKTEIKDLETS
ncbi:site-specific DNA-methyltransferase [Mycoplasma sp. SG1]|uniref:site-specific DNA-methyltransferase n=1 Tax=Mycoplasma sp. SG1 TaxID=2810348 RepID=UPI0020245837|nr:site-specific DNA-methyltransferase [Mycoplasma sp. SG1]URM52986.1 site-specific DNA-methyltransferase [Mycoplasma sp. SG1]